MAKQQSAACPCGGANYASCCGRFIEGGELPQTAEALMRSRYTAYVLKNEAYLSATWHPSTRPTEPLAQDDGKWLGLEVKQHVPAGEKPRWNLSPATRLADAPIGCMKSAISCAKTGAGITWTAVFLKQNNWRHWNDAVGYKL